MKSLVEYLINERKLWYLTANEILDSLKSVNADKKPAKFLFGDYELYPNYEVNEIGETDMFPYNEKIWWIELINEEKSPKMPAFEVINYDFQNENIKDVICVGNKWKNNKGWFDASKKKFKIISISEDDNYIIFNIDFK